MNQTHKNDAVVFDVGGRCDAIDIAVRRLAMEPAGDETIVFDKDGAFDVFVLCAQTGTQMALLSMLVGSFVLLAN